jgi:nitroreductase
MKNAIARRKSERSYNGHLLTEEDEKKLMDYIGEDKNLIGINGNKINIYFVRTIGSNSGRIGTYGVVKKAPAYMVAVCANNQEAMIDCGYVFEKMVLYLETIGVSTCWLGGTFKRKQIKVPVGEGEIIPIISPLGYSSGRKTFSDKTVRRLAKSDTRLDFDKLFFYGDFKQRISEEQIRDVLECVRLAPSASNKQPWRVLLGEDDTAHFYIERTPNYGKGRLKYDIQMVDMGIALSHYEICKGSVGFFNEQPSLQMLSEYSSYIISVK